MVLKLQPYFHTAGALISSESDLLLILGSLTFTQSLRDYSVKWIAQNGMKLLQNISFNDVRYSILNVLIFELQSVLYSPVDMLLKLDQVSFSSE